MKILTILGTRPEIIRLSKTIKKLTQILGDNHRILYTNQNNDVNLSTIFFNEFDIKPDVILPPLPNNQLHNQLSHYVKYVGDYVEVFKPDKVLILGDTNSALVSVFLERIGIKVYHVEAGNRCYENIPEELNRRIVDNISSYNLCYTTNSKNNLLEEGYKNSSIYVVGNPIKEILFEGYNEESQIEEKQILVTLHRSENLEELNLRKIVQFFTHLYMQGFVLKVSLHPRLEDCLKRYNLLKTFYRITESFKPTNHKDFIEMINTSELVITDSGTVPEECYYLNKPCIVLRNSFERKELIESGDCKLLSLNNSITNFDELYKSFKNIESDIIPDYEINNTSDRIVNIILSD